MIREYFRQTVWLVYCLWFKPYTFGRLLSDLAGDVEIRTSLARRRVWQQLHRSTALTGLLGQVSLGHIALICAVVTLVELIKSAEHIETFDWNSAMMAIAVGVAFSVICGALFGIVGGILAATAGAATVGVAVGTGVSVLVGGGSQSLINYALLGLAYGAAATVSLRVAFGPGPFMSAFGALVSSALGIWWSLTFGFASGLVAGFGCLVGYFGIGSWLMGVFWTIFQARRASQSVAYAAQAFSQNATNRNERIVLPLPFFDRLLIVCAKANPKRRESMLSYTLASDGQAWAARIALWSLTLDDLMAASKLEQLSGLENALGQILGDSTSPESGWIPSRLTRLRSSTERRKQTARRLEEKILELERQSREIRTRTETLSQAVKHWDQRQNEIARELGNASASGKWQGEPAESERMLESNIHELETRLRESESTSDTLHEDIKKHSLELSHVKSELMQDRDEFDADIEELWVLRSATRFRRTNPTFRSVQARLLRQLAPIASELSSVTNEAQPSKMRIILTRLRKELDAVAMSATNGRQTMIEQVVRHWQSLITEYEAQLNDADQRREKLKPLYHAGNPLDAGSPVFRGRTDVLNLIEEVTANPKRSDTLVLVGQPRMGKSSVLRQLPLRLPGIEVLVVDCQLEFNTNSTAGYVYALMHAITRLEADGLARLQLTPVPESELQSDPMQKLTHWLDDLRTRSGKQRVFICFDEFEKILKKIDDGVIGQEVLDQLRGLSQSNGFVVLFSGMYSLDDLARQHATYFKNARRIKVSYLDRESTSSLILHPDPGSDQMTFEPSVVESIIRLTRCQPFLVQALCATLITKLNSSGRRHVIESDIEDATRDVLDGYYFDSVSDDLTDSERVLLASIAKTGFPDGNSNTLLRLIERDYVEEVGGGQYQLQVPMATMWWRTRGGRLAHK